MECVSDDNLKGCTCSKTSCQRRGKCCLCVKHHRDKGQIPGCFFSPEYESTHDRSLANFLKMHSGS